MRVSDLKFAEGNDTSFLPNGDGAFVSETVVLSLVRHIFRDRSDMNMIPVVNGITCRELPNEYGHNVFIDVTYSTKGYRATYGAFYGSPVSSFTCYMD